MLLIVVIAFLYNSLFCYLDRGNNKKNKGVEKMRKMLKKIKESLKKNQDCRGAALALSALLGWPVLWLGVLAVCILFFVGLGWIVSIL